MTDQRYSYPWTIETMRLINELTPDIHGKAFDVDWFLLRQRFEAIEYELLKTKYLIELIDHVQDAITARVIEEFRVVRAELQERLRKEAGA